MSVHSSIQGKLCQGGLSVQYPRDSGKILGRLRVKETCWRNFENNTFKDVSEGDVYHEDEKY